LHEHLEFLRDARETLDVAREMADDTKEMADDAKAAHTSGEVRDIRRAVTHSTYNIKTKTSALHLQYRSFLNIH